MNTLDNLYKECTEVRGYTVEGVEVKKVYKRNYRLSVADKKGRALGIVGDCLVRQFTVAPDGTEVYGSRYRCCSDQRDQYSNHYPDVRWSGYNP